MMFYVTVAANVTDQEDAWSKVQDALDQEYPAPNGLQVVYVTPVKNG